MRIRFGIGARSACWKNPTIYHSPITVRLETARRAEILDREVDA
ncbi:MAG: hypothetical protein VYD70_00810 [Planctomycetota bacterium]|nr:hypothetical protein [Planctomycetota bacterium]